MRKIAGKIIISFTSGAAYALGMRLTDKLVNRLHDLEEKKNK